MDIALKYLDLDSILRLLGYRDAPLSARGLDKLHAACQTIFRIARPRATYRLFPFAGAPDCVLMAATLGAEVDLELRRTQVTDMELAALLDAAASVAIEQVCDIVCEELRDLAATKGRFLTPRFSPGYGNLPLSMQGELCAILDTAKIGLQVTDHFLLTPQKSVTAILGLTKEPQTARVDACATCRIAETCILRKAGNPCG